MDFLNTILSLILFFIALGVLITIHELGHFVAAKSFNVYCSDFSIGFGPKIVNIKRKNGETNFKIGVFPVGGYVSMYGEGVELPSGVNIPKSRSLEGISRYKRLIIMASGIVMNFVLAYIIFLICASCFPQYNVPYINVIRLTNEEQYVQNQVLTDDEGNIFSFEDDKRYVLGMNNFQTENYTFGNVIKEYDPLTETFKDSYFTKVDQEGNTLYYVLGLKSSIDSIYSLDDFSNLVTVYRADLYQNVKYVMTDGETNEEVDVYGDFYLPKVENNSLVTYQFTSEEIETFNYDISIRIIDEENNSIYKSLNLKITNNTNKTSIDQFGFGVSYNTYWNGLNSFKAAGEDWISSTTLISDALGQLFIGKGWENMGGPVAIFTQTTSILRNNPFNYYLKTWGIISVNLALFNLLPFPGLDGWQMLVTIIEGGVNLFKRMFYRKKYASVDKKLLKDLEKNEENLTDIVTAYQNKFNKTFNEGELNLKFGSTDSDLNDEEYKFYTDYVKQKEVLNQYKIDNNINEVIPFKEWKIPEKTKNIVSYIGLALLFGLMIAVFVMDIFRLF